MLIARCHLCRYPHKLHSRRNIAEHLPDEDKDWVEAKLVKVFGHPDPEQGLPSSSFPLLSRRIRSRRDSRYWRDIAMLSLSSAVTR
jgi:hypothetical protein